MLKILLLFTMMFSGSAFSQGDISLPWDEGFIDTTMDWSCNSRCEWYQPDCYAYKGYCGTFKGLGSDLTDKMVFAIARDPKVVNTARRDGWKKASCYGVATPLVGTLLGVYSSPICVAVGAGAGTPVCFAVIAGLSGAITTGVCTQLCHDHNLLDEECQATN